MPYPFRTATVKVLSASLLVTSLLVLRAVAQTQGSAGAQVSTDSDEKVRSAMPVVTSGFGRVLPQGWTLHSTAQVGGVYDDNVLASPTSPTSDISTGIKFLTTLALRGRHTRFELNYIPEFNLYRRYDNLNSVAHSLNGVLSHQISSRTDLTWTIEARDFPGRTGSAFSGADGGTSLVQLASEGQDFQSHIFTAASHFDVTHKTSARSRIKISAAGLMSNFRSSALGSTQPSSRNYSTDGALSWEYSFSPSRSAGVTLVDSYFIFGFQSNHQHYQSAQMTFRQDFAKGYELQLGVGPSFREINGNVAQGDELQPGVAFSASLMKHSQHSNIAVNVQRTEQLGLLQGSLTSWQAGTALSRILSQKWSASLSGSYTRSTAVIQGSSSETYSGSTQLDYRLFRHTSVYLNYAYVNQHGQQALPISTLIQKNRVSLGLSYDFGNLLKL